MEGRLYRLIATKEQIQEGNTEDKDLNPEPVKQEIESKYPRDVILQDCEIEQDDKRWDSAVGVKIHNTKTRASHVIISHSLYHICNV